MYPVVKVKSEENDKWLSAILYAVTSFKCDEYFLTHIGKSQDQQKVIVGGFQKALYQSLCDSVSNLKWEMEFSPSKKQKDSIDIYGECEDFVVAIELDKNRADQVAKKFVSRVALMPEKKVYFLSVCYPGTEKMNLNECIKYFGYCANLSKRMAGVYAGLVIEKI